MNGAEIVQERIRHIADMHARTMLDQQVRDRPTDPGRACGNDDALAWSEREDSH